MQIMAWMQAVENKVCTAEKELSLSLSKEIAGHNGITFQVHTIFLLKRGARDLKKQNMHGAASLKKKKTEFPTDMHAQCKLRGEKGKFCF